MSKQKKAKGNKKQGHPEAQLQEALLRYWGQKRWDAFVTLFLRSQGKALRLPEARYLDAALCNCLTDAFFVRRDQVATTMALDIITSPNGKILPLSEEIRACAAVVQAAIQWEQTGTVPTFLPMPQNPSYAALGTFLSSSPVLTPFINSHDEKKNTQAQILLDKMATQYAALPSAKTATPFTNFKKTADILANLLPEEPVFRVLAGLTDVLRQIKDKKAPLRQIKDAGFAMTKALSDDGGQVAHSGIEIMLDFLIHEGQLLYGDVWGSIMPIALRQSQYYKSKYSSRMNAQISAGLAFAARAHGNEASTDFLHTLMNQRTLWNDWEYFILCFLWLHVDTDNPFMPMSSTEKTFRLLEQIIVLLPRLMPDEPAPAFLAHKLTSVLLQTSRPLSAACIPLLRLFPSSVLLAIFMSNTNRKKTCNIEKLAHECGHDFPLSISAGHMRTLIMYIMGLPVKHLAPIFENLTVKSKHLLAETLLQKMLDDALSLSNTHAPLDDSEWECMDGVNRDFFLNNLVHDSMWRYLLHICGDEAFSLRCTTKEDFTALSSFIAKYKADIKMLQWLCQWQGANIEIFTAIYMAMEENIFVKCQWQQLLDAIKTLPKPLSRHALEAIKKHWQNHTCKESAFKDFMRSMEKQKRTPLQRLALFS